MDEDRKILRRGADEAKRTFIQKQTELHNMKIKVLKATLTGWGQPHKAPAHKSPEYVLDWTHSYGGGTKNLDDY